MQSCRLSVSKGITNDTTHVVCCMRDGVSKRGLLIRTSEVKDLHATQEMLASWSNPFVQKFHACSAATLVELSVVESKVLHSRDLLQFTSK